jgi:signal transduction histidine kinase
LKANGAKLSFAEFSNIVGEFALGGLGVFVFDLEGKCLANGENPSWVGQNMLKIQDAFGRFYVKDMIAAAKKQGKALISFWDRNANAIAYVERVDVPDGKFIIGATFYPDSKTTSAQTLVNRAVDFFKDNDTDKAFRTFSTRESTYIRGDLRIFVYDDGGTLYVDGRDMISLWRNILNSTDQTGKAVVKDIIAIASNGGGWYEYKIRNAARKVYVKPVEKKMPNGKIKNFIVGTGYFL